MELLQLLLEKKWLAALLFIPLYLIIENWNSGFNARVSGLPARMMSVLISVPLPDYHSVWKRMMNKLSKQEFDQFKMLGTTPAVRHLTKASRGYDKLVDILRQTQLKLQGNVLSLCCGRGGWEQVIAHWPSIHKIDAVTLGPGLGHEKHEHFRDWNWPGRGKVNLQYADATLLPKIDSDVILFDGGESDPDPHKEATRHLKLLKGCLEHQIDENTNDFIIKVLVPTDPDTLEFLEDIQRITGKGGFVRSVFSRTSTNELYFVSVRKANLRTTSRQLLIEVLSRAGREPVISPEFIPGPVVEREKLMSGITELKEMDMSASIKQLGEPVMEDLRHFTHWESIAVYPVGVTGSAASVPNALAHDLTQGLFTNLPGMMQWMATDTTPEGFMKVFRGKVDKPPKEVHRHMLELKAIYTGMAKYFKTRGFSMRDATDEELKNDVNKAGAAAYVDVGLARVSDYFDTDWKATEEEIVKSLKNERPLYAVANTIGKREKKETETGPKGSRMVAYYPIPFRVLEARKFFKLQELTKPKLNRFGVGGLGLHDLGMRLAENWKGAGASSDIAGFDTRIGVSLLGMESDFIKQLGGDDICERIYRVYAHPHILIPKPGNFRRTELLKGRGQRMSGTRPTYVMNTITRLAISILQMSRCYPVDNYEQFAYDIMQGDYNVAGVISGDDEHFTSTPDIVRSYANTGRLLEEIGFPRKDMPPNVPSHLAMRMEEVSFCSHNYEQVSYFDRATGTIIKRWMPTRNVSEIIGKSRLWLGGAAKGERAEAWLSAQGNNLLVNYHHLKTVRALGCAYKAVVNPNLLLVEEGVTMMPKPWMREGDILEVINTCLFGESTQYPVPGFAVRRFSDLGYLYPRAELVYDPQTNNRDRAKWRANLRRNTSLLIRKYNTGGEVEFIDNWRKARDI